MAKSGRFINIVKTPKTINNWRLVEKELEARAASLHRTVSYLVAQEAHESLMADIPGDSSYKELRNALTVSEVGVGKRGESAAYAVHAPMKSRRVRKLDVAKTVIYIRAKKRLTRADPAVQLLEDKGPWTADTIPFWPSKKEATVIQRKVTKREADRVAKEQTAKASGIRRQMLEAGRRIKPKKIGAPGQLGRKGKAVPDVAMQALELEFGGEGKRSKPVFRRMLRAAKKSIRRLPMRHRIIKETMFDPNSKRYKNFPPRVDKISSSEAGDFEGFQDRIR